MKQKKSIPAFLLSSFVLMSCFALQSDKSSLEKYNLDNDDAEEIKLADALSEISGLAFSADDRLFAHNDEKAVVFQINPENGEIIKKFLIGKWWAVEDDFEGMAISGNKFYLVTSKGNIFEFDEGNDSKLVDFKLYKTELSSEYNVEGLCYDDEINSLLLACKDYPGKGYKDERAVYKFSLTNYELSAKPYFTISLKKLKKKYKLKTFHPSGIEKHPVSKTFFLISAKNEHAILEVDKAGDIIAVEKLSEKFHRQPEGITILQDKSLIICNEAVAKSPRLIKYSYEN